MQHGRVHTLGRMIFILCIALTAATPAVAQDDAEEAPAGQRAEAPSWGSAFFISYNTDVNGNRSIELLGSIIIWFLLALSVFSIGLIGSMHMANRRKWIVPEGVIDETRDLLSAGHYREALHLTHADKSFFSRVLHAGLREANHGLSAVIRAIEQTSDELTTNRLRRIEYLNVIGQVAPMIGLFGTVYGMILAFYAIAATGGNADPVVLAGGIGTALITTFWGLIVAIPALAAFAIIRNRIDELTTEATLAAEQLLNQFRQSGPPPAQATRAAPGAVPGAQPAVKKA